MRLIPFALVFALLSSACGNGGGTLPAGATGAPTITNVPVARQNPGTCNKNPGCDVFAGANGSCSYGHGLVCVDYLGSNGQSQAEFEASCDQNARGQYSTGPCSMANLAGSCKRLAGTPGETVTRFYAGSGMSSGLAQASCKDHGDCAVFCSP